MTDAVLLTERLVLRRFREDDLAYWLEHMNTRQVRAHLGGPRAAEEVRDRIKRVMAKWNDANGGFLAVLLRENGTFLGECGCAEMTGEAVPDEMHGELEIGWQLRADFWGSGYATEAARAVLGFVFGRFGRHKVYAQTSEANRGSWRLMERLGMQRMAHLDYTDPAYSPEENPTKVYGLARKGWIAHTRAAAHA